LEYKSGELDFVLSGLSDMLQIDGIQPKLEGHICEVLICQQYWYNGKLDDEVDVLLIKADGRCHQLYFENGVVFWRAPQELPQAFEQKPGDRFAYPLVNLGEKYQLNDRLITGLSVEPLPEGAKVVIEFENGGELVIYHQNNRSEIRRITG
jgi:hypothetical protein